MVQPISGASQIGHNNFDPLAQQSLKSLLQGTLTQLENVPVDVGPKGNCGTGQLSAAFSPLASIGTVLRNAKNAPLWLQMIFEEFPNEPTVSKEEFMASKAKMIEGIKNAINNSNLELGNISEQDLKNAFAHQIGVAFNSQKHAQEMLKPLLDNPLLGGHQTELSDLYDLYADPSKNQEQILSISYNLQNELQN